jgi:hypothetical protein
LQKKPQAEDDASAQADDFPRMQLYKGEEARTPIHHQPIALMAWRCKARAPSAH